MTASHYRRNALIFVLILSLFTVLVSALSAGAGSDVIATSFIKTLGKTLCLALVAIAMDLIWGYAGILSLGHFAFFALGGYMIGMWLMYERTKDIVTQSLNQATIPPTDQEIIDGIGTQIFGVVGSNEFPVIWMFADSLIAQALLVILVPALLAYLFGWFAFRSRVTGVYLSILTQAFTLALSLYLFQNESGLRGNNGLSGLQNLPYVDANQDLVSLWFFWASAVALGLGYLGASYVVSGKFGSVMRAIRDNEARVRFLGYKVETYKLAVFVGTAIIAAIAGALYYPQAGIVNPAEMAPIASIYLAVWVAIGGRGRLYGSVIGAIIVSLLSTWFTGGQAPDLSFGVFTLKWVDWWQVLLGVSFVLVTLYAPKGIGGLFDLLSRRGPSS
ncbi:MAG: urea ABC transporter permease subunit UrtC [Rhodobacteraceae bacterium]|jgi:urea transport system permease protein|nr:urea ABC transporter permease subunit UrtC [Paracoccaceae bacterium]